MVTTLPFTVFTQNEKRQLAFSLQNPPIGNLRIRVQHWDKPKCEYNPLIGPGIEDTCEYTVDTEEDSTAVQSFRPLNMADDEVLEWQTAEETGIEISLLDDDFSKAIDGSGYI